MSVAPRAGLDTLSESEALFYKRKLSRLRSVGQHVALLCASTSGWLSPAETEELDLCVRTLVSDLRDLELLLGRTPQALAQPGSFDAGSVATVRVAPISDSGPGIRVGPIAFPVFGVAATAALPVEPTSRRSSASRDSIGGPWDFSLPSLQHAMAPVRPLLQPAPVVAPRRHNVPIVEASDESFSDHDHDDGGAFEDDGPSGPAPSRTRKPTTKRKQALSGSGSSSTGGGGDLSPAQPKRKPRGPKNMVENPICGHCNTKTTPEWRSGPNGLLLCNACGLKWSRKRAKPDGGKK